MPSPRSTASRDPRSFLPLTPLAFQVLLSIADQPRHGYAILQEISERTDGAITLRTGTLYTLLQRLLDEALIEETDRRPSADDDDARRRYYRPTSLGAAVLEAEARRLELAVGDAHRKRVLRNSSRA
jgi:DNA-binding PadR family transcriptional regulator